jgi:pantoate--beta-alanine ligase
MKTIASIPELLEYIHKVRDKGSSIGFVPTMGALHDGHLSLIKAAKKENDVVVCSIFVNPVQFNNAADLERYPRDIESDETLLIQEQCDILFHPTADEMYPEPPLEEFDFHGLDTVLEGFYRPGHFRGVAIVVKKLFEIVQPTRAYFGLKDYQQLLIIHNLAKDLKMPVEIVPCTIIRETNGLAMSSRNALLTEAEYKHSSLIYDTLKMVKIQSGFSTIKEIKDYVDRQFKKNKKFRLEYFEIVDMYSLKPLRTWSESNTVIACIAVYLGNVRLIDNVILFS